MICKALPGLVFTLGGVGLAYLWFRGYWGIALLAVGLSLGAGAALNKFGKCQLRANKVMSAALWMQGWVLVPGSWAAAAVALSIGVAVWLEPGKDASVETKKLSAAIIAAVAAFVSTVFIKGTDDADERWIGEHVRVVFDRELGNRFHHPEDKAASDGEVALRSPAGGWGWRARRQRAERIEKELKQQKGAS